MLNNQNQLLIGKKYFLFSLKLILKFILNFINLNELERKLKSVNMEDSSVVDRLLKNMTNMHELGRQRAFELGNPFYSQFKEDGGCWRKELPSGEKFLVTIEVISDEQGMPVKIQDTLIKKLESF